MISLVTSENHALYSDVLCEMWAQRKTVFVDKLKWVPDQGDGMERDQFDGPAAMYLLAVDESGHLDGSVRLLSTVAPHLMTELFKGRYFHGARSGPNIWESSRIYMLSGDRGQVFAELMCAIFETALLFGIDEVVAASDLNAIPAILRLGLSVDPLGPPMEDTRMSTLPYSMSITPAGLSNIRRSAGITTPILNYQRTRDAA